MWLAAALRSRISPTVHGLDVSLYVPAIPFLPFGLFTTFSCALADLNGCGSDVCCGQDMLLGVDVICSCSSHASAIDA